MCQSTLNAGTWLMREVQTTFEGQGAVVCLVFQQLLQSDDFLVWACLDLTSNFSPQRPQMLTVSGNQKIDANMLLQVAQRKQIV